MIDTLINLGLFSYLFGRWLINVVIFSHWLFVLSLFCLVALIFIIFIADWILFRMDKLFSLQLIFTLFMILFYGVLFFLFSFIYSWQITIGSTIFLLMLIMKFIRFGSVLSKFNFCRNEQKRTKVSFNIAKRNIILSMGIMVLFFLPLFVFVIGATPYSVAVIEIDINNQRGEDKGSNEIQISFYATLGSYDYLTDP